MAQPDRIAPPPPPRTLTPRARRRAWMHPQVRFWWICGVVLALIAGGLAAAALAEWNHERRLIREGIAVEAVVQQAGEQTLPGRKQPPDTICILRFTWRGQEHTTGPKALEGRKQFVAPRDVVRIYVNGNDPDDWTAATQPGPLGARLVGSAIAAGVALLATGLSALLRLRVVNVWRRGRSVEALVVQTLHSALSPRSAVVRCTPVDEGDRRLFTVYVPHRAGAARAADIVWILTRRDSISGAQAAEWFT